MRFIKSRVAQINVQHGGFLPEWHDERFETKLETSQRRLQVEGSRLGSFDFQQRLSG